MNNKEYICNPKHTQNRNPLIVFNGKHHKFLKKLGVDFSNMAIYGVIRYYDDKDDELVKSKWIKDNNKDEKKYSIKYMNQETKK